MEFPTLSVEDFSDKADLQYSDNNSPLLLLPFNITISDDLLNPDNNRTVSVTADAAGANTRRHVI